jgi:hypothetical protein
MWFVSLASASRRYHKHVQGPLLCTSQGFLETHKLFETQQVVVEMLEFIVRQDVGLREIVKVVSNEELIVKILMQ